MDVITKVLIVPAQSGVSRSGMDLGNILTAWVGEGEVTVIFRRVICDIHDPFCKFGQTYGDYGRYEDHMNVAKYLQEKELMEQ